MKIFTKATVSALLMLAASAVSAQTIEMKVNGLVCAFCAQGIEKTLRKQAAAEDVFVSLKHSLVAMALKQDQDITDDTLRELLQEAGYTVVAIERTQTPLPEIRARVAQ